MSIPVADRKDGAAAVNQVGKASASQLRQATQPLLGRQQHPAPNWQWIVRLNLGHQQGHRVGVSRRLTILHHSHLRWTASFAQWVQSICQSKVPLFLFTKRLPIYLKQDGVNASTTDAYRPSSMAIQNLWQEVY